MAALRLDGGKGTMADIQVDASAASVSISQNRNASPSASMALPDVLPPEVPDELFDDAEEAPVSAISAEDGESLIGLAMSRAATRLKSPETPAVEKQTALEDEGGYFDSDPETPPTDDVHVVSSSQIITPIRQIDNVVQVSQTRKPQHGRGMSLKELPPPTIGSSLPSPWLSGPKQMVARPSGAPQSSLSGVFGPGTERKRSLSGGADALRRLLPKGLPSMAQVGNLFGSSSTVQKSRLGSTSFPKDSGLFLDRSASSSVSGGSPGSVTPQPRIFKPGGSPHPQMDQRPQPIRRIASDDSMLYHSLSRASSLGDDSRFEHHHEQVNSRIKAIRDSLQDRSSFRMPNLSSLPSMPKVPGFGFNMNFLNSNNVPTRWKSNTDENSDILPGTITKKKPPGTPTSVTTPKITSMKAEPTIEPAKSSPEGSNTIHLDQAMESLTGDIVIMGGYRGSILRSTKTNRQVWVPVKVGLNIRKVNLEVGLEPEDEERMSETIYASGMLQNIGPVDISKRLFKRLTECENAKNGKLRVWDFGYDWRLSPHLLSKRLTAFLEKLPSNQLDGDNPGEDSRGALVIAHSLGGVITRHVVNHRPELFSGVIYAGVPQSCINILGPMRNGDAVLLSSRVLTAQVNFTLRTSFVLLPEDGSCFVDIKTKEKYPVDFFNLETWIKYRLSPCTDPPLPPWSQSTSSLGSILGMGSILSLPISAKKAISWQSSVSGGNLEVTSDGSVEAPQRNAPKATRVADALRGLDSGNDRTIAPQMGNSHPENRGQNSNNSVSTAVTIPREKAITYLRRTLAETKKFKQELHFKPELSESNRYPPLAVIYGKSIPTCCGAKVDGMESVPHSDVYDNLAFASGDGVCLAKEAMLPEGYKYAYGGRIRSDRGHVTLLGDLNGIGRAMKAVSIGRLRGIGLGTK